MAIVFYWGALGLGLKAARAGELDPAHIVLVIVLPLALLFIREPLHNLLHKRKLLHSDPFSFALEACIETLETLTAFLGSTVSFARVGAFALSHAALCLAIFSVADILREMPGGGLWAAIVLVLGNLAGHRDGGHGGDDPGRQAEYYELFSKYFAGDGVPYHRSSFRKQINEYQQIRRPRIMSTIRTFRNVSIVSIFLLGMLTIGTAAFADSHDADGQGSNRSRALAEPQSMTRPSWTPKGWGSWRWPSRWALRVWPRRWLWARSVRPPWARLPRSRRF